MTTTRSNNLHIDDIPDILIANVAEYLPTPSRAMLALALTTSPSSWRKINWNETSPILKWANSSRPKKRPSPATKSILTPPHKIKKKDAQLSWEVLDFGEVERGLAAKLTDDDIAGILSCINSVKHLKTLKLTGCVNVSGYCLEPLRGSLVLEHIDLGLVGPHEDPFLSPEPLLSEDVILPVLQSILAPESHGSSLTYLMLPKKIRAQPSASLDEFLGGYDQLLQSRMLTCSKCYEGCTNDSTIIGSNCEVPFGFTEGPWAYGMQGFTCHKCEKSFCSRAECDWLTDYCTICEKDYCKDCVEMDACFNCDEYYCKQCQILMDCNWCHESICETCFQRCKCCDRHGCQYCLDCWSCERCSKSHCKLCFEGNDRKMPICDECDTHYCSDCQFSECSESWKDACKGCLKSIGIDPSVAPKLHVMTSDLCEEIGKLQVFVHEISIEGCGVSAVNGVYAYSGYNNDTRRFSRTAIFNGKEEVFMLFRSSVKDDESTSRWYISIVPDNCKPDSKRSVDFYATDDTPFSTLPPRVGWSCIEKGCGTMPAPRVVYPVSV